MLPFASFFLFSAILLLFSSLESAMPTNFFSFSWFEATKNATSSTQIKHFSTPHRKKLHRDGLRVSEKNSRNVFPTHDIRLTCFTIEKPVSVHFVEKKMWNGKKRKITLLQFQPAAVFHRFFSSPCRHEKLEIALADVVAISLAGVKSGAGQDSRLIKNSPAHFPDDVIQTLV